MTSGRPLRRDAAANRERLLATAQEVFEQHGIDAGVDLIAATAGVGVGTLYRHFPTKSALYDAVSLQMVEAVVAVVEQTQEVEPGRQLEHYVRAVAELQPSYGRLVSRLWTTELALELRQRVGAAVHEFVVAGQRAGTVRPDLVDEDIPLVIWSLAGVRAYAPGIGKAWRRMLDLACDGLRPAGATPLSAPPLDADELESLAERRPKLPAAKD
ncbi:MAG: TetR/AcrR family transcriptional regulator [Actinomycetota bacterium]|nr:MAG: TetR/AcrR family transcriptional regulator [Actinomycetota bacterium]